ncbi:MAG: hypothetical protein VX293_03560 [Candidatus Latescibacterota bacterium]|nr:hypothetical protein [Candidatus Latescibacterota bacterium]
MSVLGRRFWWGLALVAALYLGLPEAGAIVPIMGLGEGQKEREEQEPQVAPTLPDSAGDEALQQLLLFMPFRDKSKYKGEWNVYSELPRGLADSLRGSTFFRTLSIDSVLVRLEKRELQGKLDPERALDIGRELGVDYVVLGQIDEMSMKRFRATVPIGGYRSYQGLTIVQLFPYKVIDGEPAGDVVREAAEDSKRYGITNPAAYVPLEKEYFLLGQMEWGSEEFHQTLLGKSVSKCLDLLAVGLDSLIQPPAALRVSEPKLISIDGIQAYINVGLADSVQNGNKYGVWDKGRELRDPDTDEVLGKALSRRVGVVQIEQVLSDHLSLVRILDGQDAVEEGFGIRAE